MIFAFFVQIGHNIQLPNFKLEYWIVSVRFIIKSFMQTNISQIYNKTSQK